MTLARPALDAPRPPRRPHALTRTDGSVVDDPWYWLRERDDPTVRAHLEAENAYEEAALAPHSDLITTLYEGIRARVEETDASAPVLDGGWLYYTRTLEGRQRPIHARRPAPTGITDPRELSDELRRPVDPHEPPADEQVLLDEDEEAGRHAYFRLGGWVVSPDHTRAAELVDLDGGEVLTVRVRDLATGEVIDDAVRRAGYGLAWHEDGSAFLYTVTDEAWRPHRVLRHRVGTPVEDDETILVEDDERFWLGVGRTRSDALLLIHAGSRVTDEWHVIDATDPTAPSRLVVPRREGVEVDLEHVGDTLYLTTNADGAADFRIDAVALADALADPHHAPHRTVVAHRPGVRVQAVDGFATHLVLVERTQARRQVRVLDPSSGADMVVDLAAIGAGEVAAVGTAGNPDIASRVLRVVVTSLVLPVTIVDVDLDAVGAPSSVPHDVVAGAREALFVVKTQSVRGGYDASRFVTWREWAEASDGTLVPISCVRRADVALDGTAPCLLYGYGSYEASMDPTFSAARLELLERGLVYAIAHVRGGGEMGRPWYEGGRLATKPNTFTDFIACAHHLAELGVVDGSRIAIRGGSAGGLLIGAVLNLAPELAAVAVAEVPFVDVLTTMSDPTIPLTVIEYDEWGDPSDPAAHAVMATYSPYDNVRAAPYPLVYVTAGLNDPRVAYWEPAKWVARLREATTSGAPVLLRTELEAGHGGRSGRYEAWEDEARVLAVVLVGLGVEEGGGRR